MAALRYAADRGIANMTRISFPAINIGRKFIAGRIVNAFGFSHSLLQHFHNRGVKSEGPNDSPRVDARPKKRFRGINIADPRYMTLVEQK
jgi:hypothetical protein